MACVPLTVPTMSVPVFCVAEVELSANVKACVPLTVLTLTKALLP